MRGSIFLFVSICTMISTVFTSDLGAEVYDHFDGSEINPDLWYTDNNASGLLYQSGGFLIAESPPYSSFGCIDSKIILYGDFEVVLPWFSLVWDLGSQHHFSLNISDAFNPNYFNEAFIYLSHDLRIMYDQSISACLDICSCIVVDQQQVDDNIFRLFDSSAVSGFFKITRVGSTISVFYDIGAGWVLLTTAPNAFTCPVIFSIYAQTGDIGWSYVESDRIEIHALIPGDLLLGEGAKIVPGPWSHIGMYIGNGQIVESHIALGGVEITQIESWFDRYETWAFLRVVTADDKIRKEAVNWATHQDRLDDPYDRMLWQKDANGEAWYCSELVWAAYLHASNEQINIEFEPDITGITPYEIFLDEETEVIAENYETALKGGMVIISKCPVDLEIVDPDNLSTKKTLIEIPGAIYGEDDIDGDGSPDDWIGILERKMGQYRIRVVPEPDVLPTVTYTLEITTDNETTILAEDVQINNIPAQPYIIRSTESEIIPVIPATIDFEPDTLNLKGSGKWITVYIELPVGHGYAVGDIDVHSILLEGLFEVEHSDIQDGVLMVKFSKQDLIIYLESVLGVIPPDEVTLTLTGKLTDETPFEGSDTIRVIKTGGEKK